MALITKHSLQGMAVTQKRINRAQPLLAGEWRPNALLARPCGRVARLEVRKESLLAPAALQQVAELLFLQTGLQMLLQNTHYSDRRKLGEEATEIQRLEMHSRHSLSTLSQHSGTNLSARKMQLLSSAIIKHFNCPKLSHNCIFLPSCTSS